MDGWPYKLEFKKLINYPQVGTMKALEFLKMLNTIKGVSIGEEAITRYPTIPIAQLNDDDSFTKFIKAVDWMYNEIATRSG